MSMRNQLVQQQKKHLLNMVFTNRIQSIIQLDKELARMNAQLLLVPNYNPQLLLSWNGMTQMAWRALHNQDGELEWMVALFRKTPLISTPIIPSTSGSSSDCKNCKTPCSQEIPR